MNRKMTLFALAGSLGDLDASGLLIFGASEAAEARGSNPSPANSELSPRPRRATQLRLVSIFRHGWVSILVALLNHHRLPLGRFAPEPWPSTAPERTQGGRDELPLAA